MYGWPTCLYVGTELAVAPAASAARARAARRKSMGGWAGPVLGAVEEGMGRKSSRVGVGQSISRSIDRVGGLIGWLDLEVGATGIRLSAEMERQPNKSMGRRG